ncbi:MAG: GNAT family N-acetyltransferase [Oscillospiraceae bacterium]
MEDIFYKRLELNDIAFPLFDRFNRYQNVTRCWRKENDKWFLKDIAFTEQWDETEYHYLVGCLKNTILTDGAVFGAFCNSYLVGFASVERLPLGSMQEYVQLSSIHTSQESRGRGIGKVLFNMACTIAKEFGATKLYISAHSSEETQAFYRIMGCAEAKEYNNKLVEEEPCDCQLEYVL